MASKKTGNQTFVLCNPPSIAGHANVVGQKEGAGPLKNSFDLIGTDDAFGERSWEKAEVEMQKRALSMALEKAKQTPSVLDFLFAGDLLNQCISAGYAARGTGIPFFGLYGACSTMAESLGLARTVVRRRIWRMGCGGDLFPLLFRGAPIPHTAGIRRAAHPHFSMDRHSGWRGSAGQKRGRALYHPRHSRPHPGQKGSKMPTIWAPLWPGPPTTPSLNT